MVQSEQHVIYRLVVGKGREAQANMEETDGESGSSRKLTLKKGAKAENNNIGLVYTNKTKLSRKLMTSRLSQITTKTIGQYKDKNEHILYQSLRVCIFEAGE